MILPRRKNVGPLISSSCSRQGLRLFLLLGVFMLIMSAYWWNFERHMQKVGTASATKNAVHTEKDIYVIDNEYTLFSDTEVEKLEQWRKTIQTQWDMPLYIHAAPSALMVPQFSSNTLYVGVGLKYTEAVIIFPSPLKEALGEGVRVQTEENLAACLSDNTPGICLDKALNSLWNSAK